GLGPAMGALRPQRAPGEPGQRRRVAQVDLRRDVRVGEPGAGVEPPQQRGLRVQAHRGNRAGERAGAHGRLAAIRRLATPAALAPTPAALVRAPAALVRAPAVLARAPAALVRASAASARALCRPPTRSLTAMVGLGLAGVGGPPVL